MDIDDTIAHYNQILARWERELKEHPQNTLLTRRHIIGLRKRIERLMSASAEVEASTRGLRKYVDEFFT